jgi:Protein of unknown function VcgC/VcgE (DUF2780)
MKDLIDRLTREVGVTEAQARGGTAALFKAAEQRMQPADFEELLGDVPGVRDLLNAAPQPSAASGLLGGLASMIGGADSDMAQATRILTAFGGLGMGKSEIMQFVPVIADYLKTHGGEGIVAQLRAALRL